MQSANAPAGSIPLLSTARLQPAATIGRDRPGAEEKFKVYPIGCFHAAPTGGRATQGKLHLFGAIERISKFAFVRLAEKTTRRTATEFPAAPDGTIPYKTHAAFAGNGTHFTTLGNKDSPASERKPALARDALFRTPPFRLPCARKDSDHRLTKPGLPWTNHQVERRNRTLKEATMRTYHHPTHARLRGHLVSSHSTLSIGLGDGGLAISAAWMNPTNRFKTLSSLRPPSMGLNFWTRHAVNSPSRSRTPRCVRRSRQSTLATNASRF